MNLHRLLFLGIALLWVPVTLGQDQVPVETGAPAALTAEVRRTEVLLDDRDQLFGCDFGVDSDQDFDDFPDGWQEQRGFGFPKYNEKIIVADETAADGRSLQMTLDGQRAAVYSEKFPVGQKFSYVLNAKCRVQLKEGHNCQAWASINFLDENGAPVSTYKTPVLFEREGWYHLSTRLLVLGKPSITHASIGLHVDPLEETSLFGRCWFDDVTVYQLPRIVLQTGQNLNIFTDPSKVELHCEVSGARRQDAGLQLELFDERGNLLRSSQQSLLPGKKVPMRGDGTFKSFAVKHLVWRLIEEGQPAGDATQWHGYYRLVIKLLDRDTRQMVREISFVVVDPAEPPRDTQFGWSLTSAAYDLDHSTLVTALGQLGVNWVKLPVWIDVEDYSLLEKLNSLLQKLNRQSIDVVGVLDEPPKTVYERFWQHEQGMAALTADQKLFEASIEPVMTQLSLRIGRWQLGSDEDTSIAEDLAHIDKMKAMKTFFIKYGDESKVGLPWTWMLQRIDPTEQAWDFTSTVAYPELSASEMEYYSSDVPAAAGKEHYISLQPLPELEYGLMTRVRDYTKRFIEVKRLGLERVFVPRPFDDESGFFREGEMPTEMLCPWKILSSELNGATYMGSFQMPGFSENHMFEKNGAAIMLVWNDQPTTETLFLGQQIKVMDLWGRKVDVQTVGNNQTLHVDGWPLLVKDMNLAVAKIRQSFGFDKDSIDSVMGTKQALTLNFKNGFDRGISGGISLVNETLFSPEYTMPFKAARGEAFQYTLPMQIHQDALAGDQLVRLDFQFHNEELIPFSAWQPLSIGLKDVEFATRTKLTEDGQFLLKMTLINRSESPVSYVAYLLVPGEKRKSVMFHNVKPGQQSKLLRVFDAQRLVGQSMWLSAREAKGTRNLNYRIKVE